MNTKWIKRAAALLAISGAAVAVGAPTAEAATATGSFTVQTTVFAACTLATNNLNFAGYTTGQITPVPGSTNLTVTCPGATASPLPVTLTMSTASGFYRMVNGVNNLNYRLCQDAPCATLYGQGTAGAPVTINNGGGQAVSVFGDIPGAQVSPAGAYSQLVNVTLTY